MAVGPDYLANDRAAADAAVPARCGDNVEWPFCGSVRVVEAPAVSPATCLEASLRAPALVVSTRSQLARKAPATLVEVVRVVGVAE